MDIIITRQNLCQNFKNKVSKKFKISSYCDLSWFLNIKIEKTENKKRLSQEAYNEKIKKKYKMSDCRSLETHLDVNSKLSKLDSPKKEAKNIKMCSLVIIGNSKLLKLFSVGYQTRYCTYS